MIANKVCNRCGQGGLYWESIGGKWRLFENGEAHHCQLIALQEHLPKPAPRFEPIDDDDHIGGVDDTGVEEVDDITSEKEFDPDWPLTVSIDIDKCSRCGSQHFNLDFHEFVNPCKDFTHFAMCPTFDEPILAKIGKKGETKTGSQPERDFSKTINLPGWNL